MNNNSKHIATNHFNKSTMNQSSTLQPNGQCTGPSGRNANMSQQNSMGAHQDFHSNGKRVGSGRIGSNSNPRKNRYTANQSVNSNGNNGSGMPLSSIENTHIGHMGMDESTMNESNNG